MADLNHQPNIFAGPYLDRSSRLREDRAWLNELHAGSDALLVPVWRLRNLVGQHAGTPVARLLSWPQAAALVGKSEDLILLGEFRGRICLAFEVPEDAPPDFVAEMDFQDLRGVGGVLPGDEAGLLAYARAMVHWRSRHRYCGTCGGPTVSSRSGHLLKCSVCDAQQFPRIDPAIIVLVSAGQGGEERALLGRKAEWPPGRYSTIAGFVEPGESLEDAVAREVLEETGVETETHAYHSSQPWPFPASLMLGFTARARSTAITCHDGELEDARWFSRSDLIEGRILMPPRQSISFRLIDDWRRSNDPLPAAQRGRDDCRESPAAPAADAATIRIMCLLLIGWKSHPRYRLVLAGNRDEFHDRAAAPLNWWQDDPRILGGRDLQANGTWLGVARSGRFGVVTNFRDLQAPIEGAPSRGSLIPRFLTGATSPKEFLDDLRGAAPRYSGFNLLVGGPRALYYFSNRGDSVPRALPNGIHGISNHLLDTPWPKLTRTKEQFTRVIGGTEVDPDELFRVLGDRQRADKDSLPATGLPLEWEHIVSAPFIVQERYGTRCSSVLLVERTGRTVLHERRFDATGLQTGSSRFEFKSADLPEVWFDTRDPDEVAIGDPAFDSSPE